MLHITPSFEVYACPTPGRRHLPPPPTGPYTSTAKAIPCPSPDATPTPSSFNTATWSVNPDKVKDDDDMPLALTAANLALHTLNASVTSVTQEAYQRMTGSQRQQFRKNKQRAMELEVAQDEKEGQVFTQEQRSLLMQTFACVKAEFDFSELDGMREWKARRQVDSSVCESNEPWNVALFSTSTSATSEDEDEGEWEDVEIPSARVGLGDCGKATNGAIHGVQGLMDDASCRD